ncbi:MAG TPA: hypothetical protein DCS43_11125 [Verrucomicrobia bacterium]|nr:hypothetical protein [Verrucomicrobiota bacterium]
MMKEIFHVIQNATLELPATEVVLLIGLVTLALVSRYNRCGMTVAYIFSYRWGWMVAKDLPAEAQFGYVAFGVFVGALATIGMLTERNH